MKKIYLLLLPLLVLLFVGCSKEVDITLKTEIEFSNTTWYSITNNENFPLTHCDVIINNVYHDGGDFDINTGDFEYFDLCLCENSNGELFDIQKEPLKTIKFTCAQGSKTFKF